MTTKPSHKGPPLSGIDSSGKPVPAAACPERLIFSRNLRRARLAAGLTQANVMKETGLSQSFISWVENGKVTVAIDNAALLARAVGKPLWELFVPNGKKL